MKKILLIFIFCLACFLPIRSYALIDSYEDVVYDNVGVKIKDDVVNIYLFYGSTCPHCADEKDVLKLLEEKYKNRIKVYKYEVWENKKNHNIMMEVKEELGVTTSLTSVPFTVIGTKYYTGYSEFVGKDIERQIRINLGLSKIDDEDTVIEQNKVKVPFMEEANASEIAVGTAAVILGFVDGFNPCAMWILLFIINMLFGMKDKKKMFLLGYTFLFTSALFYFLSMLGINIVLGFISTNEIRGLIGIVAIIAGIYNLYVYYRDRKKEDGCQVVDEKKRKNIMSKLKKIKNARNIFFAFGGIIALAISVNMVELACSAGFPTIFNEILVANNVTGIARILYLLLYVFFYMIDDMIVFTISISTLTIAGVTTKYNKLVKIIGGVLMIVMGLLLIFKPDWIMLNF